LPAEKKEGVSVPYLRKTCSWGIITVSFKRKEKGHSKPGNAPQYREGCLSYKKGKSDNPGGEKGDQLMYYCRAEGTLSHKKEERGTPRGRK